MYDFCSMQDFNQIILQSHWLIRKSQHNHVSQKQSDVLKGGQLQRPRGVVQAGFFSSIDRCSDRWSSKVYLSPETDSKSHDLSTLEGLGSIPSGQISGSDLGKIVTTIYGPHLVSILCSTVLLSENTLAVQDFPPPDYNGSSR